MRVAILCLGDPERSPGGAEMYSTFLASVLPGARVVSLASVPADWRPLRLPGFSHPAAAYRLASYFACALRREFDCAIAPGMTAWYFQFANPPCPVITVFHGNYAAYSRAARSEPRVQRLHAALVWSRFEAWAGKRRVCVSVSESVQKQVRKYYGVESRVIYNSTDLSRFVPLPREDARARLGWPDTGRCALFVGRPSAAKGFDLVVKLARACPQLTIACAVPADPPAGNYPDNMLFSIRPPRDLMPVLYSASEFVLAPSAYEGCSLVALEAMSCNAPMITSRTGIFLDKRFEPAPDGIQVLDPCDVSGMRAAMDRLPDRREVNLRSYVNTHFSPQVFRESYQALVDQACSQMHG